MKKKKGFFSISAVAEMFSIHQQTIRMYERQGFIAPKRSEGNTRLFTEEDIVRLEEIIHLTHKLGINLAGVEVILKQQKKIKRLQKEINSLFKRFQQELQEEEEIRTEQTNHTKQQLARLKQRRDGTGTSTHALTVSKKSLYQTDETE